MEIIDQRWLPHRFIIEELRSVSDVEKAIREMHVRGAPLIGVTAAYGMYLACLEAGKNGVKAVLASGKLLKASRPTAVNLAWAVDQQLSAIGKSGTAQEMAERALVNAKKIEEDEVSNSRALGEYGVKLIERISRRVKGRPVNILTHCNAGWLACVDYGTATAPIYEAKHRGIPVHVWVDETRPWNQGARLTAWELLENRVPHTLIPDNTGGHLMQHGMVDLVIVGADRVTRAGDAANKIGTYLKALAAKDNKVPFYVALTSSAFDWRLKDGLKEIPIEERGGDEVRTALGLLDGKIREVLIAPKKSPAANYGFDVTPARLVTGLITERGICRADENDIRNLFPDKTKKA